jgi:hypothetical protein
LPADLKGDANTGYWIALSIDVAHPDDRTPFRFYGTDGGRVLGVTWGDTLKALIAVLTVGSFRVAVSSGISGQICRTSSEYRGEKASSDYPEQ